MAYMETAKILRIGGDVRRPEIESGKQKALAMMNSHPRRTVTRVPELAALCWPIKLEKLR